MISYKPGVSGSPSAEIAHAISVAERVYAGFGVGLVVTSLRDGRHSRTSYHYSGDAVDLRRWNLDRAGKTGAAVTALRSHLGAQYDVILESDHIHIEFNRRRGQTAAPIPQPSKQVQGQAGPQSNLLPSISFTPLLFIGAIALFLVRR